MSDLIDITRDNDLTSDPVAEGDNIEDCQEVVNAANIKDAMTIDDFVNLAEEMLGYR